jgi:hypothetical protein
MLKNPYTRIAVSVALATMLAPRIFNAFLAVPEMGKDSGLRNDVAFAGLQGATTAFIHVVLTMAIGAPAAA